jgi:short-subunit dehydrogenase involved in D-alanine esterification of teichoic acids
MTKKIAITGGAGGIGSAFTQLYGNVYSIKSLSRTTGHHIQFTNRILRELLDSDIFINLATYRDSQTMLLHGAYKLWKDCPKKLILNVGSCAGLGLRFPISSPIGPWDYASTKAALYCAFDQCLQDHITNDKTTCQVKMITFGPADAGPNLGKAGVLGTDIIAKEMQRLIETQEHYHSVLL